MTRTDARALDVYCRRVPQAQGNARQHARKAEPDEAAAKHKNAGLKEKRARHRSEGIQHQKKNPATPL